MTYAERGRWDQSTLRHSPEELVAALVAAKLGRPVKWTEDRREHFLTTTQQRDPPRGLA